MHRIMKQTVLFIIHLSLVCCQSYLKDFSVLGKGEMNHLLAQSFHQDAHERTLYKFTTLLISNLIDKESDQIQRRLANCIYRSWSRVTYGKCVRPLLAKHYRTLNSAMDSGESIHKIYKREIAEQMIRKKSSFSLDQNNKRVDFSFGNLLRDTGQMLTDLVRNVKIFDLPSSISGNSLSEDRASSGINSMLDSFLKSPLLSLKNHFDVNQYDIVQSIRSIDLKNQSTSGRYLSPRLLPLFEDFNEEAAFLSPDILSLYQNSQSPLSFNKLLNLTQNSAKEPWFQFFREVTGVNDIFRMIRSGSLIDKIKKLKVRTEHVAMHMEDAFDFYNKMKVEDVYKLLSQDQLEILNGRGYAVLEKDQMELLYKGKSDVEVFMGMSNNEKELFLLNIVEDYLRPHSRKKRQNAPPCTLAPYVGGTTLTTYLMAPQTICPSVFSYIVLGPLVLSPYVLSPYVMGPFILSPEVLTPFVLSPYVLSPNILTPAVLSPFVLNPVVLSPNILSPTVLNPSVLSPTILSPGILSPGVLSPTVLSPGVLSPSVLSPCALCRRRRRRSRGFNFARYRRFLKKLI